MSRSAEPLTYWENLHQDPAFRKKLPPSLKESWERCLAQNIPGDNLPPQLSREEMRKVKQDARKLYVYTSSILKPMFIRSPYPSLGGLLFNQNGVLLRLYGPQSFLDWAKANQIAEGTKWSETAIGPNIFSQGINQKKGVKIEGGENYARFLVNGAYYFAPIALPNGETFGGLGLAVPYAERGDHIQTFALMAARMIELQFFWFNIVEVYGDSSDGQGMITLDQSLGQNHILTMSKEVFKMLGMKSQSYYYERLESFIDPLPKNKDFWNVVEKNAHVMDKRFEISVGGKSHVVSISTSRFKEDKFHMKGLVMMINSIQRINRLVSKYSGNEARYHFTDIIGNSPACIDVTKRSKIAATSNSSVLLLGESGVGKDIIAQAIHNGSNRNRGPFVAINCAAFSKELIASELFGYESGAFTGAKKDGSIGKFELANQGTLFLDEIGDMPLDLQALMLRAIEQRSFMKVGGNTMVQVDARIIAATNINLAERIRQGMFREDLFYRLGIVRIQIPPLRQRGDDIFLLTDHFIPQICARLDKPKVTLSEDAKAFFHQYDWPGNVRELQNLLEGLISTHNEPTISAAAVRQYLGHLDGPSYQYEPEASQKPYYYDEREELIEALQACRNNRTKAAQYLGISRRTLYRRLMQYNLM